MRKAKSFAPHKCRSLNALIWDEWCNLQLQFPDGLLLRMKRIHLNGVREPIDKDGPILEQRLYTVHLGNRVKVLFASLRHAKAFQAETDRWISLHLSDCNFVGGCSRGLSPCLPLMDKAAMERVEHRSRELIENAWRGMDMALATGSGTNGWVMAWKHLEGAVECINRLALLLRDPTCHGINRLNVTEWNYS